VMRRKKKKMEKIIIVCKKLMILRVIVLQRIKNVRLKGRNNHKRKMKVKKLSAHHR